MNCLCIIGDPLIVERGEGGRGKNKLEYGARFIWIAE